MSEALLRVLASFGLPQTIFVNTYYTLCIVRGETNKLKLETDRFTGNGQKKIKVYDSGIGVFGTSFVSDAGFSKFFLGETKTVLASVVLVLSQEKCCNSNYVSQMWDIVRVSAGNAGKNSNLASSSARSSRKRLGKKSHRKLRNSDSYSFG